MTYKKRITLLEIHDDASKEIIDQALYFREQSPGTTLEARWDHAVMQAITSLLSSPERGSVCPFHSQGLRGMRRIPVPGFPKHYIFYCFTAEERTVRIVHVLHAARDLDAFFAE